MHDFRVLLKELVHGFLGHFALRLSIVFIADEDEGEFLRLLGRPLVHELVDPGLDVIEGLGWRELYFLVCDVIDQHTAVSSPVKSPSQTPELFLTGSVPDLKLWYEYFQVDDLSIHNNFFLHEVCPDRSFVRIHKFLVHIRVEQGCLADTE